MAESAVRKAMISKRALSSVREGSNDFAEEKHNPKKPKKSDVQ